MTDVWVSFEGDDVVFGARSVRARKEFAWKRHPARLPRGAAAELISVLVSAGLDVRSERSTAFSRSDSPVADVDSTVERLSEWRERAAEERERRAVERVRLSRARVRAWREEQRRAQEELFK